MDMADLKALAEAVIKGNQSLTVELTTQAIQDKDSPQSILDDGLIGGMDELAARWKRNEVYIPEILIAARAMKAGMEVLEPILSAAGIEPIGKCLVGTVQGDLHDIGKNLVIMMLKGAGFDVVDAGIDIAPEKFIEMAKSTGVSLIGLSALLTTTMPGMEKTIKAMKDAGITAKIMVGGAPVTQQYANKIGADGYSPDAASAVDLAKKLLAVA